MKLILKCAIETKTRILRFMCTHPGFGSHFTRQNDILFSCWINILTRGIFLTLLHSERPKLYAILAFLSAIGLKEKIALKGADSFPKEFP